ncbi:hydrogen peroxide-inducible genes activator [Oryzibacter oryziterrae]|uniref:hydrogen peroxide-inducible genes activator n=1 Tax=Oryzibacter oryziterrae TaxID=2766474 RepID=UPI001F1D8E80|nr:hydrogen peroxide-inducible genes activator [Oryzibacter oryziterrae]
MKITLRQLRYLDALASEGHFGRAADKSAVTQPALSTQIRELEEALGCRLVERVPSGARLTTLGGAIVERARRILADVGELEDFARAASDKVAGPLSLGVIPSIAPYLLPRLLPRLAETYPDLRLTVRETVTATLVEELNQGHLDVIVASSPLGDSNLVEWPLFRDTFLLALPPKGPYALGAVSSAADIPPEALLLLEDGHCLRDQTLASCGAIDARRLRNAGVTSLTTILHLVAAGQGITLLPELFLSAGQVDESQIRLVRFAEPEPHRMICVAWRKTSPLSDIYEKLAEVVQGLANDRTSRPVADR